MNFKSLMTGIAAFAAVPAMTTGVAYAQDNAAVQADNTFEISANDVLKNNDVASTVKSGITRTDGWYPRLHVGGTAQFNYNKNVDGVDDGVNFAFGLVINTALDRVWDFGDSGMMEWQNKLDIEESMTKTPSIDSFVKSKDKLDFQTLALYRIPGAEWVAPFLSFRLESAIFPSKFISNKTQTLRKFDYNTKIGDKSACAGDGICLKDKHTGLISTKQLNAQDDYALADSFNPLTLTERIGAYFDAYQSVPFNATFTVAFAGQELVVTGDNQYVAFDDDADDEFYDVRLLKSTNSLGIEGAVDLKGVMVERFSWNAFGRIYYPFVVDEDHGLEGADLIHAEIGAKVGVKISDWGSFAYTLEFKRDPFVTTLWQISTNVLFTVGFDIFK